MKKACALLLALAVGASGTLAACGRGLDDEMPPHPITTSPDKWTWTKNSATPIGATMSQNVPNLETPDVLGVDAYDAKTDQ
jgi:predicted small lipoprotein YifL